MNSSSLVLIIDDDESILSTFSVALEASGYRVVTARDGREGLEMARQHLPEVILTDINMPGADGKTLLRQIREDSALAATQLVFMTGHPQATPVRKGMELGADDFLVKPFSLDVLQNCIEARMRRARVHWRVEDKMLTELRSQLHSNLPHEFFTPLSGVLGLTDVLRSEWRNISPEEVNDLLREIQRSGWRLQRTLRNYLWIVDESLLGMPDAKSRHEIDGEEAASVIQGQVEQVAGEYGRQSDLSIDSNPMEGIVIEPMLLEVIVSEIMENACAYSPIGSPLRVSLGGSEFCIADRGRGMNEEQVHNLRTFQQFERKQFEQQGLGLGLALVTRLLQKSGGDWEIQSRPGEGTEVRVILPGRETAQSPA